MGRRFLTCLAVLALVIAACGGSSEPEPISEDAAEESETSEEPGSGIGGLLAGEVAEVVEAEAEAEAQAATEVEMPGAVGAIPVETRVTCGGPVFPVGALAGAVPLAGSGLTEIQTEFNAFISANDTWPTSGWKVLVDGPDEVVLVRSVAGEVGFMAFANSADGWGWSGSSLGGPCRLRRAVPEGYNEVVWEVDPAVGQPSPDSTTLQLVVTEIGCSDGNPIGSRLIGPEVVETDEAVFVAFAASLETGLLSCPGNPTTALTVELETPLGDRELRDLLFLTDDFTSLLG